MVVEIVVAAGSVVRHAAVVVAVAVAVAAVVVQRGDHVVVGGTVA